jgi:hypothetical protein
MKQPPLGNVCSTNTLSQKEGGGEKALDHSMIGVTYLPHGLELVPEEVQVALLRQIAGPLDERIVADRRGRKGK